MKFKGTITIHFTAEAEDAAALEAEAMLALDDMLLAQDEKSDELPRIEFDKWKDAEVEIEAVCHEKTDA